MNPGRTVFAQLLQHVTRYEFDKCVRRYDGNYRIRRFPCYDQLLCLAFAQLTYRESLRDIETCLNSHHEKLYHVGFRGPVSRSTLADANELRDYRIYQDFGYHLIAVAQKRGQSPFSPPNCRATSKPSSALSRQKKHGHNEIHLYRVLSLVRRPPHHEALEHIRSDAESTFYPETFQSISSKKQELTWLILHSIPVQDGRQIR